MGDVEVRLESIRAGLSEASRAFWRELVEALEDETGAPSLRPADAHAQIPTERTMVALRGVDPSQQCTTADGAKVIVHLESGQAWGIRLDNHAGALVRRARELQSQFGFAPETRWDVVGRFVDIEAGIGEWALGSVVGVNIVRLRAVRFGEQFALMDSPGEVPKTPGLAAAEEALAALHGDRTAPRVDAPSELLPALLEALETNHWRMFKRLWVDGISELDLEYSFRQYRRAFTAARGEVRFVGYAGKPAPADPKVGDQVRILISRVDGDGRTLERPLLCRREEDGWKLSGGIL